MGARKAVKEERKEGRTENEGREMKKRKKEDEGRKMKEGRTEGRKMKEGRRRKEVVMLGVMVVYGVWWQWK